MKKSSIFYTVALGILCEALYTIVIIGIGSIFVYVIQFIP